MTGTRGSFGLTEGRRREPQSSQGRGIGGLAAAVALLLASALSACSSAATAAPSESAVAAPVSAEAPASAVPVATSTMTPGATPTATLAAPSVAASSAPLTPAPSLPTACKKTRCDVAIRGFAFTPGGLTIRVGTTVRWTNDDSVSHTVKAGGAEPFASQNLGQNASFSQTFKSAGSFAYICGIHPEMTGTIVVTM